MDLAGNVGQCPRMWSAFVGLWKKECAELPRKLYFCILTSYSRSLKWLTNPTRSFAPGPPSAQFSH